jgi:hypothetical protein
MNMLEIINELRSIISSIDLGFKDEQLEAFAPRAYGLCIKWFGLPVDADRQYRIIGGPLGGTSRDLLSGHYMITIPPDCPALEQRVAVLSHEMYHRVTMRRRGLRCQRWIDEMMAEMTALMILREEGFADYADHWLRLMHESPSLLDARALRHAVKRKSILLGSFGFVYPAEYGPSVIVLGTKLERLVGWDRMCRIVHCRNWDEWLVPFPANLCWEICRLLDIPKLR